MPLYQLLHLRHPCVRSVTGPGAFTWEAFCWYLSVMLGMQVSLPGTRSRTQLMDSPRFSVMNSHDQTLVG